MGKKGKLERKPKQRAEQTPRPGQDAFGETSERSSYAGQAPRGDAFGEAGERSGQPGRAQQQSGRGQQQQQRAKRPSEPQQPEM
jgi:hypothetical protein